MVSFWVHPENQKGCEIHMTNVCLLFSNVLQTKPITDDGVRMIVIVFQAKLSDWISDGNKSTSAANNTKEQSEDLIYPNLSPWCDL